MKIQKLVKHYLCCLENKLSKHLLAIEDKKQSGAVAIHYLYEDYKEGQVFIGSKYYTKEELFILEDHFSQIRNVLIYKKGKITLNTPLV
tara:strand:- start:133 stop:399 length:267 start_codon:yes stop_codon:yes gene_type:complete